MAAALDAGITHHVLSVSPEETANSTRVLLLFTGSNDGCVAFWRGRGSGGPCTCLSASWTKERARLAVLTGLNVRRRVRHSRLLGYSCCLERIVRAAWPRHDRLHIPFGAVSNLGRYGRLINVCPV